MSTKTSTRKQNPAQSAGATAAATPPTEHAANGNGRSLSSADTLRHLFASLLRCRRVLEHLQQTASADIVSPRYDVAIGHEAVVVGATMELRAEDTVAASRSNVIAHVARGVPLPTILRASEDKAPATGDALNFATGMALTHKLQGRQNVSVALCGPVNSSLDAWNDALKFAGAHKLPLVYVVESGGAGEHAANAHPAYLERISFVTRNYSFPGIIVDGQDVVAVWRVAHESIHRARNGSGPTLIDCRMDPGRDPLQHLEHYMRKRNVWHEGWREALGKESL